jgi:hypothetical protein
LLIDIGESSFIGFDDLVTFAVQTAAKDQVVKCVRRQMLNKQDPKVFLFANVLPVIIFATLQSINIIEMN